MSEGEGPEGEWKCGSEKCGRERELLDKCRWRDETSGRAWKRGNEGKPEWE